MAIRYENHCCDCAVPGYPCRGNSCSLRHVPVPYCDKCGYEIDGGIYEADGYEDLCLDCLKEMFRKDV